MSGWRLEHTYAALPALFHARARRRRCATRGSWSSTPALATTLGLDAATLDTPDRRRNLRRQRAARTARGRSRRPTPATSSVTSRCSATAGPSCSASRSTPDGAASTCSSRAPARRRTRAAATAARRSGRCCANWSSARRCTRSGIPTSRSLAVVSTGEPVQRERVLPGAVLTRIAASHLRVGTFEWAAAHRDPAALVALADYTLRRHYPEVADARRRRTWRSSTPIVERQARPPRAVAARRLRPRRDEHRQHVAGRRDPRLRPVRVHGCLRSGHRVQLHRRGRDATPTATSRRSPSGTWRAWPRRCCRSSTPTRRGRSTLPNAAIERFAARFEHHWLTGMRAKLGLVTDEPERCRARRRAARLDARHAAPTSPTRSARSARPTARRPGADGCRVRRVARRSGSARLGRQPQSRRPRSLARMQRSNPAVIPRNHLVEAALTAAADAGDLGPLERLLGALATPYDHAADGTEFTRPARARRPAVSHLLRHVGGDGPRARCRSASRRRRVTTRRRPSCRGRRSTPGRRRPGHP